MQTMRFLLSDALTQQIEGMRSQNAVLAFEENILQQYVELVRQRLAQSYSVPVMRVIHYIENRLDQKVLLEEAAAYAGVHAAYGLFCFPDRLFVRIFQPELLYHAVYKGDGNDPDGVPAAFFGGVIHW